MKIFFAPIKFLLIFLIALMPVFSAAAQDIQYRDPDNPDRGYWQIVTSATTKSTVIQFFDGQKKQIYEETIPGKYIKLTGRNITRINRTFDQIAGKTMVLNQVKAEPLTSPAFRKLTSRQSKKKSRAAEESAISTLNPNSGLKLHTYQIYQKAKFYLVLHNPGLERINVSLLNREGRILYHYKVSTIDYNFKFNFEGMEYGKYKLVVTIAKSKQKYTKIIEVKPPAPLQREKQPPLIPEISHELANR